MREISLHILDLAENSITAGATELRIEVFEDTIKSDFLEVTITDNGKGIEPDKVQTLLDPFVTERTTRKVGLGLPLTAMAAAACNGGLKIESKPGKGAKVRFWFQHSHLDRAPLGKMAKTVVAILVGGPNVNLIYIHRYNGREFIFESRKLSEELGLPLQSSQVLGIVRDVLENGLMNLYGGDKDGKFNG